MCGICGIVLSKGSPDLVERALRRMVSAMSHRGPDDASILLDGRVGLGHVRLSIIDPVGGSQPMTCPGSASWITYNGELFNYRELKAQLEAVGHRFATDSDTEVVLQEWDRDGADGLARMNGQWAFGVWNRNRGDLALVRDPLGIRPLFYATGDGLFLFASEIKALLATGLVSAELDPFGIAQAFAYWAPHPPRTAFEAVRQLPPGSILRVDPDAVAGTPERYWRPDPGAIGAPPSSAAEAREQLVALLDDASRLRYERADTPVGVLVSGGLDSSVTTTLVRRHSQGGLRAFSVGFPGSDLDESAHQDRFVAELGIEHDHLPVSPVDIADHFPAAVFCAEQPILRTAPVPMLLLAQHIARASYKVVVTGEGADELFAGYDVFREVALRRRLADGASDAEVASLLRELYPWESRSVFRNPQVARSILERDDPDHPLASHLRRWRGVNAITPFAGPRLAEHGFPAMLEAAESELSDRVAAWSDLQRATVLEMTYLLPDYLLSAQSDRMLMASSVEGRFPFLDPRVATFALSIPDELKLDGFQEKAILRRAFSSRLPAWVTARRKQPYQAPGTRALASAQWLHDLLDERAVRESDLFKRRAVRSLIAKMSSAQSVSTADSHRLVGIASTMLLCRRFAPGRESGLQRNCRVIRPGALRESG